MICRYAILEPYQSTHLVADLCEPAPGSTWMTADYELDFRNISIFPYSANEFPRRIINAVDWAEDIIYQREYSLRSIYPWR